MTATDTATITTADLRPGMVVRRFPRSEPITVASILPSGARGAQVTDTDGHDTVVGLGATWHEVPTEVAYADAENWWVQGHGCTVREHLYAYRGVLGSLASEYDARHFTATDGYDLFRCTVRLVSITSSRFIFTAHKVQEG